MSAPQIWLEVLREACDQSNQVLVAQRIGYSAAVINQTLKGTYKGDLQSVQKAVEGALMGSRVNCPVIGEIPQQRCIENQRMPFAATNPTRVQLYRACRGGCVHSLTACKGERSKP